MTWLMTIYDTTPLVCMWYDMTHSCVTWLIHVWHNITFDVRDTTYHHMCHGMTHSYVYALHYISPHMFVTLRITTYVTTWLIHTYMRYTTYHHTYSSHYTSPHISRHDSFTRVTPHTTHSCVQTQPLRALHASKSRPWLKPHVQSSIIVYFWHLLPSRCIFESYGVATISRLLKITGLFCKRAL